MLIFKAFTEKRVVTTPVIFTFGTFDGVHLGHQKLFQTVVELAKKKEMMSALLTFSNHPFTILCPEKAPLLLTTAEEKRALIEKAGLDLLIELPFTKELAALSGDDFIEAIVKMLNVACFVAGEDVVYGKGRSGNREHLLKKAEELHFGVQCIPKFLLHGESVSSTRIRALLQAKNFSEAARLLGH
jgi:riboflavin kinase/FMN adenylyltransferase